MAASLLIWILRAIFCEGSAILADHALLLAHPVTVRRQRVTGVCTVRAAKAPGF